MEDVAADRPAPARRRVEAGQAGRAGDAAVQAGRAEAEEARAHPVLRGRVRAVATGRRADAAEEAAEDMRPSRPDLARSATVRSRRAPSTCTSGHPSGEFRRREPGCPSDGLPWQSHRLREATRDGHEAFRDRGARWRRPPLPALAGPPPGRAERRIPRARAHSLEWSRAGIGQLPRTCGMLPDQTSPRAVADRAPVGLATMTARLRDTTSRRRA